MLRSGRSLASAGCVVRLARQQLAHPLTEALGVLDGVAHRDLESPDAPDIHDVVLAGLRVRRAGRHDGHPVVLESLDLEADPRAFVERNEDRDDVGESYAGDRVRR